jgi:hypothetical protein
MNRTVVTFVLLAATLPAGAAAPADSVDRLVDCADLSDGQQRLACFDREVAPLRSARTAGQPRPPVPAPARAAAPAPSPTPAPAAAVQPVPAAPSAPPVATATPAHAALPAPSVASASPSAPALTITSDPTGFGAEDLPMKSRPQAPQQAVALRATIAQLRQSAPGEFMVTLDNGQVWRTDDTIQGRQLAVADAVTISRASLGSYRMTRDAIDAKSWLRVRRVR